MSELVFNDCPEFWSVSAPLGVKMSSCQNFALSFRIFMRKLSGLGMIIALSLSLSLSLSL
jgi:hypothetical protein